MASKSLEIILKHGLGDHVIKNKNESGYFPVPFNIEEACREIDQEIQSRDELLAKFKMALEFYAYQWRSDIYIGPTDALVDDAGKIAREALK